MSKGDQAIGGMERMRPRIRVIATLAACVLACGAPAAAQTPASGWTLIVRIVPNPMPIGRCGGITVEVQDDEGYRRNELSNGGVIDFHTFRYDVDTTNFQWQNGNPVDAVLCTRAGAPPSSVTVTVTLPDGLAGSVQLTSIVAGQYAAAVQYAKQGPLRRPGVPPPHASTRTAAVTAPAGGAPGGGTATASTPAAGSAPAGTTVGGGHPAPTRSSGTASRLTAPGITTTTALSMTGAYAAIAPMAFDTPPLSMTGNYAALAAQVVTTSALSMTGGFAATSQLVTTQSLSMVGSYSAIAPQTVVTSALTMTGNAGP